MLLYTASGRPTVQCLAFSTDGRTFTKYAGNPIVPQITAGNRDPKVIWHEPTRRWVMVLYVGLPDPNAKHDEKGRPVPKHTIHFLTSPDLKEWTVRSQVEGFYECPDLFELPVDGEKSKTTWVLSAANSHYMLGQLRWRTVHARDADPDRPARGCLLCAADVQRHARRPSRADRLGPDAVARHAVQPDDVLPLHAHPARDPRGPPPPLVAGRGDRDAPRRTHTVAPLPRPLKPGENPLAGERGELLDIQAEFEVGDATAVGLAVRGTEVVYDSSKRTLTCNDRSAPLAAEGGRVRLRILADRTSLEIFGDDGMIYMPMAVLPREGNTPLAAFARGGTATLHALDVHELHSIWPGTQAAVSQAAEVATPIDVGRQLFVDDHLIGETTLTRTFHRARLHEKNPVLAPETPTEMCVLDRGSIPVAAPFDDGVFYDPNDRLFKMWYHGGWFDGNCYAVSKDGLSWERPALDVTPGTNRVLPVRHNPGGGRLLRDGTTVWLDQEAADPAQRFKMFVYSRRLTDDKSQGGQLFTSADGIHWGEPQRMSGFGYGDNSSFFRDPFRNEWVFSIRRTGKSPVSGKGVRVRSYLASRDFLGFTRARDDQVVDWLAADDRDKPDPAPDLGYEPQLYKVGAVAYESLMVGLFGIFYGPPNDVCDREKRPKIIDLEVGFSRDGRHYERPDRHAFIACSRAAGHLEPRLSPFGGRHLPHRRGRALVLLRCLVGGLAQARAAHVRRREHGARRPPPRWVRLARCGRHPGHLDHEAGHLQGTLSLRQRGREGRGAEGGSPRRRGSCDRAVLASELPPGDGRRHETAHHLGGCARPRRARRQAGPLPFPPLPRQALFVLGEPRCFGRESRLRGGRRSGIHRADGYRGGEVRKPCSRPGGAVGQ